MTTPTSVSVVTPITPALQRVKTMLFAPFDLRKWFVIGFCAWLSSCGEGGGGGGGGGNFGSQKSLGKGQDLSNMVERGKDYVLENLGWILPLVILLVLLGLGLWALATWLNSRGKFMLLHCVALDRAEVEAPWNRYAQHAQSFFLFQLVLGLLAFFLIGPLVLGSLVLLIAAVTEQGPMVPLVLGVAFGFLVAMGLGIVFAIVKKLAVDFVVPIMFLRTPSVKAGWREFRSLAAGNFAQFLLYLLFSLLLAMAIGMLILVLVVVTCCVAGCLFALPYLGTVLLLPVFVFSRSYSLYYLAQYGPQYDVFPRD